jgi:hypothetical protein
MRKWILAAAIGPSLVLGALDAHAENTWKKYEVKELGVAFWAPGKVETATGTYKSALTGSHSTQIFKLTFDNIDYVLTVVNLSGEKASSADILGERTYTFQEKRKLLADNWARVETGKNQVFGRKLAVEEPGGKGRTLGAFYFTKGKLFTLEATVLPANGDYLSSTPVRFIDSVEFSIANIHDAIDIEPPKLK